MPIDARAQLEPLIEEVKANRRASDFGSDYFAGDTHRMRTRLVAAIERLSLPNSTYRKQLLHLDGIANHDEGRVLDIADVAQALLDDIESGYLQTVAELIHGDVFADFLDMAAELQGKGYKDAAAVIAGSSLEEHLRKLAERHGVTPHQPGGAPKKATVLNADLAKAEVYTKLEERQVDAWQAIRNAAAHGEYGKYDHGQVASLIAGARDFMIKHPA